VRAQLVVLLALLGIAEDLVGFVQLLEARLRRRVAWIDVGVVLARELPVRLFDLLLGGGLRHAEGGVVVFEIHRVIRTPASGRWLPTPGPRACGRRAPPAPRPASTGAAAGPLRQSPASAAPLPG